MKLWIARDSRGLLFIFANKPEIWKVGSIITWKSSGYIKRIPVDDFYPNLTLENSPQELKIE